MTNTRALKRKLREAEDKYNALDLEYQGLSREQDTLSRKTRYFQEELATEASANQKFELNERLKAAQTRLDEIETRRDEISERLGDLEGTIELLQAQLAGESAAAIAAPERTPSPKIAEETPEMRALLEKISEYFAKHELRTLAFNLGVDFDELETTTKTMAIISLIEHLQRRGRLAELLSMLRQVRPKVDW